MGLGLLSPAIGRSHDNSAMNQENEVVAFSVRDLELERGERLLFTGLHFDVPAGTVVRLAGANGTGKTSLLRLLTGLMQPDAGEICYRGRSIAKLKEDYYKDLVYIGHMNGVKDDLSAIENVRICARMGNIIATDDVLVDALSRVGLSDFVEHTTGELSQGQRRRVALARLFVSSDKPVWILDEPFTALDVASVTNLSRAIADHVKGGGIVIYTTHQECPIDVAPDKHVTVDVSAFAPVYRPIEEAEHV